MPNPTLVLDLDGTLADTSRDLIPVLNRTIATVGLPSMAVSDVGYLVGKGIREMLIRAHKHHGEAVDDRVIDQLFDVYLADYTENLCVNTVLFPNVEETLNKFLEKGWTLAVCTNKHELLAKALIKQLGVAQMFDAITGADTFAFKKPDARHLTETINMVGGVQSAAVMVGDSITDIQTAKNASIPSIGVTFGYTDVPIEDLEPDLIIDDYNQLFAAATQLVEAS